MGHEKKDQEQKVCSAVYCNLQAELKLNFSDSKNYNYKKKAVPRICFQVLTQSFLDIIKKNMFKLLTKSRLVSQNS